MNKKYSIFVLILLCYIAHTAPAPKTIESIQACVIMHQQPLTDTIRKHIAHCLKWPAPSNQATDDIHTYIQAEHAALAATGTSTLHGNVEIQRNNSIIHAQTARLYRDPITKKITHIELINNVQYYEPGKLLIADHATFNADTHSGRIYDVLYRFMTKTHSPAIANMSAWGQARFAKQFTNKDYIFKETTYTTCAPQDLSWHIKAQSIQLNHKESTGTAHHAVLYMHKIPIFYTPYLTFPTNKARKSGFLLPTKGYSNVGGFDIALPYYLNLAPNYDATITPRIFTRRGLMLGGQFRYLTSAANGIIDGTFLPSDPAYRQFLQSNSNVLSNFDQLSTNRWLLKTDDTTQLTEHLNAHLAYQQVSDNYYLQDFSNNLDIVTQRQLLQQGDITYADPHWLVRTMLQRYQTIQPINEVPILDTYERLPQIVANGIYTQLPMETELNITGEYDQFQWPNQLQSMAQGPRLYINPALSIPRQNNWSYIRPSVELVGRYYTATNNTTDYQQTFSQAIPRYMVDSGLYFDRTTAIFKHSFTQTLEPRLYYLYVPYQNQTAIPVYDSAYMIFNLEQLFRNNRFSGFDRIGDANQVALSLTSRWIDDQSGMEKITLGLGELFYFSNRQVVLCQSNTGTCEDSPYTLGYLSPTAQNSPIAARAVYAMNKQWSINSDYVWNPNVHSTNNAHIDLRYQALMNHIFSLGYTYMVNGDLTALAVNPALVQGAPLNQASFAYAWPFNDQWSSLGAYSYDISQNYTMMAFLGVQYDSCCWAVRVMGGESFQSFNTNLDPIYNKNIYFQILWKGLGSVGTSDPQSVIKSFLPNYIDEFH